MNTFPPPPPYHNCNFIFHIYQFQKITQAIKLFVYILSLNPKQTYSVFQIIQFWSLNILQHTHKYSVAFMFMKV